MKLKEKWAEENLFISLKKIDHDNNRPEIMRNANNDWIEIGYIKGWLAGFEFAKRELLEIIETHRDWYKAEQLGENEV